MCLTNGQHLIAALRLRCEGLDGCWAVDDHYAWQCPGAERTTVGELVYRAKPYGSKGSDRSAIPKLAAMMVASAECARPPLEAAAVVAVPAHNSKQGLNLPDALAPHVAEGLALEALDDVVRKVRSTPAMKARGSYEQKQRELRGAFEAAGVTERRLLLIDDLFFTGATLSAVAAALRAAGATSVSGLVASRVKRGLPA